MKRLKMYEQKSEVGPLFEKFLATPLPLRIDIKIVMSCYIIIDFHQALYLLRQ